jgi:hypothetical protein
VQQILGKPRPGALTRGPGGSGRTSYDRIDPTLAGLVGGTP